MRTHSGERPFQCDICLRKFTLKHSMLRHQKKHSLHSNNQPNNNSASDISDDESSSMVVKSTLSKLLSIPDLIPKELSAWRRQMEMERDGSSFFAKNRESSDDASDLIGNLLGISDQGILNKVLLSSPDEAAKLLGVEK